MSFHLYGKQCSFSIPPFLSSVLLYEPRLLGENKGSGPPSPTCGDFVALAYYWCIILECISKVYCWSVFLERITLEGENKGSGPPSFCCTCVLQECNWSVLPSVPQVYRSVFIRVSFKSVFLKRVTRVCYQSVFLK